MQLLTTDVQGARSALLRECPRYQFPRPWDFIRVQNDVHGCCVCPGDVLTKLLHSFDIQTLEGSGIAIRNGWGDLQIAPELCSPLGTVVPLYEADSVQPFGLWTRRGQLAETRHPALFVLRDSSSAALAAETGVVFVVSRIQEVALLRELGLAAVRGPGLHRTSMDDLRQLDLSFGEGVPARDAGDEGTEGEDMIDDDIEVSLSLSLPFIEPDSEEDVELDVDLSDGVPEFDGATRPAFVLLGFPLLPIAENIPAWIWHSVAHLTTAREQGRLPLSGIWIARPEPLLLERLQFAIRHRDSSNVRELLLEAAHTAIDFDALFETADAPALEVDYLSAHDRVRRVFSTNAGGAVDAFEAEQAVLQYQAAYDRVVWWPLV